MSWLVKHTALYISNTLHYDYDATIFPYFNQIYKYLHINTLIRRLRISKYMMMDFLWNIPPCK